MASIAEFLTSLLKEQGIFLTDLNPLYFLPAVAVIVCCLVYAFGFKSSSNTLPPSSLALLRDEPKNKQKIKANGITNKNKTHGVSNGSVSKPKAVVKPVKRQEVKSPKTTPAIPAPVKNLADNDEVEDLNSGDWVTVVSDKAKKEKKKQQKQTEETSPSTEGGKKEKKDQKDKKDKKNQEKNKKEKEPIRTRSVTKQEKTEVEEPAKKPTVISLESLKPEDFENWSVEEPVEGKVQMSKKSLNKKSSKEQNKVQEKLMERQMSREEQKSDVPDVPVVKEDKITKDILTQYDAPVVKKEAAKKKTDAKKKSVDEGNKQQQQPPEAAKKANAKKEPKKEVKKDISSGDNKKDKKKKQEALPVAQKTLVAEEPVAPKTPSTDVTDATESDPSEGEFKVVRKRKARRE